MLFVLRLGLFVDCVGGMFLGFVFYCKFANFHLLFEKLI